MNRRLVLLLLMSRVYGNSDRGKTGDFFAVGKIFGRENIITSFAGANVTQADNDADCATNCFRTDECVSFFYNQETKRCQLHWSGLYDLPVGSFTEALGYNYYRMKEAENGPVDCYDHLMNGKTESGIYIIFPDHVPQAVYCDQETDGGGWLVFQRRRDGSEDFYRGWNDYEQGFGNLSNEFWIGNQLLASLTSKRNYELRIDMESFENESRYASYGSFSIGDKSTNYRLHADSYSGTAGDSLEVQNGFEFTTKDYDNDIFGGNCAVLFKGAWWYANCHNSNLNGLYLKGSHTTFADGVNWRAWKGHYYSLKTAEMKCRPTLN